MQKEMIALLPAIRRFAYSLTGSVHDADDLLQSTVERVLAKGVPDDVDLKKWMFRVCKNIFIDDYRARKVRLKAAEQPELREASVVDGESIVQAHIRLKEVHAAMAELPDDQRTVISMVAIQGLPFKEVAEILEIPLGTVMSRLGRARAFLTSRFKQQPERSPA